MRLYRALATAALLLSSVLPVFGAGNGLKGEYFGNTGLAGTPAAVRTDSSIDFSWRGSPAVGVASNYFSVRWTGKLEAPVTGAYTFSTYSNEAVRVWLGGTLVIDHWTPHSAAMKISSPVNLTAGTQYDLKVEFYDGEGSATAKLFWSYPGQGTTTVDTARLYSDPVMSAPVPVYLSDLSPTFAENGWGPYQRDSSNGEAKPRDGNTQEIKGVEYGRGLGVHARSELRYALASRYRAFYVDLGVDDETDGRGSVVFEVWMDGVRKFVSDSVLGGKAAIPVGLDVTGVNELKLIVLDASDGNGYDHADWAGARVVNQALPVVGPPPPGPPATPTGLSSSAGNAQVSLLWNAVSGATGYNLYRSVVSGTQGDLVFSGAPTTFLDTAVVNGTTYFYSVAATNAAGPSAVSSQVMAKPLAPPVPAAPTGLGASAGNAEITLNWTAGAGAASYNVYRSTISGLQGDTPIASNITTTTFKDTGVVNGTTYFYKVAGVNGNGVGPRSNEASAKPLAPPVPAAPASLTAMPGNSEVTLNWGAASGAASYNVYRSTSSGAQGDTPIAMGITVLTFKDTGLTNGTTYYYKIAGVNANGTGAKSNEANAKPTAPVPPAPASLTATPGNAEVTLTWGGAAGAATYNVYRSTTSGAQGDTPIATDIAVLTFKDTGLTNGTTYYYKVAAVNGNGTGAKSNEANAKPTAPVPPAPTGLTATAGNTEITLNWTAAPGASTYNVYRSTVSGGQGDTPIATGIAVLTFKDTGLTNGTFYYYKVAGVNENGTGAKSAQASAKPALPALPPAPTGVTATPANSSITLSWNTVSTATSYNVYRATASGQQGDVPVATGITGVTFLDTGLTNGTRYFYKVASVNITGTSGKSSEVNATPFAAATVLSQAQKDAFKFLRQATWGPTMPLVDRVVTIGKAAFLEEQFALPASEYPQALIDMPNMELVSERFFQNALQGNDQLRQRVAWALSQIWVASAVKVDNTHAMVPFIRILQENAFGNVRDVLEKVTLSPAMGEFLDMVNNKKADPTRGTMPNENYARELMQLFTIGLVQLNPDGSTNNQPAYSQNDILEMSRVLTGWTYGDAITGDPTGINPRYYAGPMEPVSRYHDTGSKTVLGVTFPANQTARADLAQALDTLFNHPNIGPFLVRQLIQRLVKSNPSPQYIADVVAVFNNNGQSVRGDLKAVVRAILLHPEAAATPNGGKFSEPALFLTTLARGLNSTVVDHPYMTDFSQDMSQRIWFAPSVFNYFSPGYRLNGVPGPELQIWSTATAMTRTNFVAALVSGGFGTNFTIDTTPYVAVVGNLDALVETANARLMGGTMGPEMKQAILTALASSTSNNDRIRTVLYLIGTSMQYQVER